MFSILFRFTDAFTLLISLPKDTHIWCGHGDVMGPLIETFYNYFKDDRVDSPLKVLWKRISEEMRLCAQCICQHHQTQEMYEKEYECSSVGPLLDVLRKLDEERVTRHLQEINSKIEKGTYDPDHHHAQVVSVMYEVLWYICGLRLFNTFFFFHFIITGLLFSLMNHLGYQLTLMICIFQFTLYPHVIAFLCILGLASCNL